MPRTGRKAVLHRDLSRCVRCGGHGYQWHHRRSRRVKDEHTHCTCNGVMLCATCHRWCHLNPEQARAKGLVVSEFCVAPALVPYYAMGGWWELDCEGEVNLTFDVNITQGSPQVVKT